MVPPKEERGRIQGAAGNEREKKGRRGQIYLPSSVYQYK
jgi:hypothetical protein